MASIWLRNRDGMPILDVCGWVRPKEAYHWKPGRSAMELARAWFPLTCPTDLRALLQSNARTVGCQLTLGEPEFVTPLPERGEGRNHDLWLQASSPTGNLTICIEARADESFGNLVHEEIAKAKKRTPKTRLPARAEALLQLLFERPCEPLERPWSHLRYQLITALAGTVIQASRDNSPTAVFVVHEFLSNKLDPERQRQNHADIASIAALLIPGCNALGVNTLVGPVHIGTGAHLSRSVELLIGKIQHQLSSAV